MIVDVLAVSPAGWVRSFAVSARRSAATSAVRCATAAHSRERRPDRAPHSQPAPALEVALRAPAPAEAPALVQARPEDTREKPLPPNARALLTNSVSSRAARNDRTSTQRKEHQPPTPGEIILERTIRARSVGSAGGVRDEIVLMDELKHRILYSRPRQILYKSWTSGNLARNVGWNAPAEGDYRTWACDACVMWA
jgi:hypothetical protein